MFESIKNIVYCVKCKKWINKLDICHKYPVTQDNNTVCNQCIAKDPEKYDINSKTNVAKRFNK